MRFLGILAFSILLVIQITSLSCTNTQSHKSLKLAHGLDVNHSVHKGMEFMADRLAEKSDGKLTIEIYPSQQLGTERQCLELLQIGSLAMTKVSAAVMENFSPNIKLLSLPYLFRDREHAYKVFDGPIGRKLLEESDEYWLRGLTYFDAGQRSFYAKKPIRTPADLKGLKIRVQESPTAMSLVRALGGAPTPISWGELYTGLQQGVVDGAENNPPSFYLSKHYEVCKYYTLNEHTAVPDILVMSTVFWDKLSEEEKKWVQEAADEATIFQRELWQKAEQEALDAVKDAGVEIIIPDKSLFSDATQPLIESFRSEEELYDLVKQIQAIE
jgi:tripartite ATP-independent transporter DctP family solute receptor